MRITEHEHFVRTMDAITTRNPRRMKPNGMEMLRAKVRQLKTPELRAEAQRAYEELEARVEEESHGA